MTPHRLHLSADQIAELDELYRTTQDVRVRTRAQMILLSAEQGLTVPQIAVLVRKDHETVRRWLLRYLADGIARLPDRPRSGGRFKTTPAYRARLLEVVRQRPRALGQPFSLWTCQRLADFLAEETGLRVCDETVRNTLRANGIVLSRPQHTISSPDPEYAVKKKRSKKSATT